MLLFAALLWSVRSSGVSGTPELYLPFSVPSVSNYNFDKSKQCIGAMTIEIDFLQKKSTDSSPYDSDRMAAEFIQQFNNQAFSVTQQVCTLRIRLALFFALPLLF